MPFVWAAYNKGAFGFPEGLTSAEVREHLLMNLIGAAECHILTAQNWRGANTPVGLVTTASDGYKTWPRLVWFPWSTRRNKVESFLRWVNDIRKTRMLLFHVEQSDRRFMDHMCRYGVMRCIGLEDDYFAPGVEAWAFQSRLVKDG